MNYDYLILSELLQTMGFLFTFIMKERIEMWTELIIGGFLGKLLLSGIKNANETKKEEIVHVCLMMELVR